MVKRLAASVPSASTKRDQTAPVHVNQVLLPLIGLPDCTASTSPQLCVLVMETPKMGPTCSPFVSMMDCARVLPPKRIQDTLDAIARANGLGTYKSKLKPVATID